MRTDIYTGLTAMSAALLLTWAVEGAITLIVTESRKYLLFNVWVNAITNPILNFVGIFLAYRLGGWTVWVLWVTVGEITVLFSEAWLYLIFDKMGRYAVKSKRWYLGLSAVTNVLSFFAGILMNRFL